ncbi:MAG TPA: porin, partial [Gemmataceae bacterium]|nr:porin [Gemmataceae bacterium]
AGAAGGAGDTLREAGTSSAAPRTARPGEAPNVGGAPDQPGGRLSPIPGYGAVSSARAQKKSPLNASFGPGFELLSEDEEFQLQFHQETQLDYKEFEPNGDQFARSGFVFPRVRAFFNGRVTKPWEYTLSLNRGLGAIDILDAFVNYHTNDRLQLKVGRFMTPFNYEQFAIQNMWLIAPERSLFTANLGLNRMLGVQLWGITWKQRLDYAVGVFNGPRNSFEDFNESKDVMTYLNVRPFGDQGEGSLLRNLNLGGSYTYGFQENPLVPRAFRTASNASNASAADLFSPPFFAFNQNVLERGERSFWSAHAAYFFRSLSLFADYNGGDLSYVQSGTARAPVGIPASGFSAAFGYFLTGETIERRTVVEPLRPLNLSRGQFALGAWELAFRYSTMELDPIVFDAGLADRNLWSNRAWITNLGVNWYPTRYIKVYTTWQHTEFGDPVIYRQGGIRQLTNELFWLRLQLYF